MNIEKIIEKFSIMADISLDEAAQWSSLIEETANEIKNQLKDGLNETDYEGSLNSAAAVLTFYKYTLFVTSRSMSFSISGGISTAASITDRRNMLAAARTSWENTRASMSNILKDPEFIFQGVK